MFIIHSGWEQPLLRFGYHTYKMNGQWYAHMHIYIRICGCTGWVLLAGYVSMWYFCVLVLCTGTVSIWHHSMQISVMYPCGFSRCINYRYCLNVHVKCFNWMHAYITIPVEATPPYTPLNHAVTNALPVNLGDEPSG